MSSNARDIIASAIEDSEAEEFDGIAQTVLRRLTAANLLIVPREVVEEAYREGFQSGADHGNLSYKYPPENIAWRVSYVRAKLTGEAWRTHYDYDWEANGDDPDVACCCTKMPTQPDRKEGM